MIQGTPVIERSNLYIGNSPLFCAVCGEETRNNEDMLLKGSYFLSTVGGVRVAKLGDYGLAKAFDMAGLSGHTYTGEVAGPPQFMPRQQVRKYKDLRPEADVWAMAATLYRK